MFCQALLRGVVIAEIVAIVGAAGPVRAQQATQTQQPPATREFEPQVGQAGKDVVWVPSSPAIVEKMLDVAKVTPRDFVIDLGSGDGRNVIAAAKRGARALGVEYNPDMVELSRRNAAKEGVADRATFVQGDMYEADISQATALILFLLPDNLGKLRDKFLSLKPGTRIVDNTFAIPGWEPDLSETVEGDCTTWCTALMWIVPAKVDGTWRLADGELALKQEFQMLSGTLTTGGKSLPIDKGRMRGDVMIFTAGGAEYTGRVNGGTLDGIVTANGSSRPWRASR
jgi:SAM-dependent methyltransferase